MSNAMADRQPAKKNWGVAGYLLRHYPGRSLAVSVCFLLSGLWEGIGVGAVLPLLNLIILGNLDAAGALGKAAAGLLAVFGLKPTVGPLLILILAAFLLKAGIVYAAMRIVIMTASEIVVEIRRSFLRSLLDARWDFFQRQPAGRLGSAISVEAEQVADIYLFACRIMAGSIQVLIYLGLAFAISWPLSLCALAVGGISYSVLNGLIEKMRRASTRFFEVMRSLINGLVDALQGLKPLKAMGLERRTEPFLAGEIAALKTFKAKSEMNKVTLDVLREPLQLITAGLGFYIAYRFLKIGFAEMALTLLIFTRVLDSTTRLQSQRQSFARLEPAFWLVKSIMDEAESWREVLTDGPSPDLKRHIKLAGVTFRRGKRTILEDVSLEIKAGRTTMLRGPSGAGKTTVADLVAGLIRPDRGRIMIDGNPLDRINLKSWRSLIGYVPQELFLFHDTVASNITLGDTQLGREDVEAALRAAGAWDFVQALPDGLLTIVGERGSKLSGGQRQRIAIARALLRRPRLLILDEATSGLDPRAEEMLIQSLKKMKEPPTVLVISHRSSFSRAADVIYAFQGKRIKRVHPAPRAGKPGRG